MSLILGLITTLAASSPLGGITLHRLLAPSIMTASLLSTQKRGAIAVVVADSVAAVIVEMAKAHVLRREREELMLVL